MYVATCRASRTVRYAPSTIFQVDALGQRGRVVCLHAPRAWRCRRPNFSHITHDNHRVKMVQQLSAGVPTSWPSESTQNTAIFPPELFCTTNQTCSQDESLGSWPKSPLATSRLSTGQYRVCGLGSPVGSATESTGPIHLLCLLGCREAKPSPKPSPCNFTSIDNMPF